MTIAAATLLFLILFHRYRYVLLAARRQLSQTDRQPIGLKLHLSAMIISPFQLVLDIILLVLTTLGAIIAVLLTASLKSFVQVYASIYDEKWLNIQKEAFNIFNNTKEQQK